jgi:hypothetical protein
MSVQTMNDTLMVAAANRLRDAVMAAITPSLGTLTLGLKSSTGREIPLLLQRLANGQLLVSDAGETWAELIMTGHATARPTRGQTERLARLVSLYRVSWDDGDRALQTWCSLDTLPDAAGRVTAASIALDGWRVLSEEPEVISVARRPRLQDLSERVARRARDDGWEAQVRTSIPGRTGFAWPAALLLRRGAKRVGIRVSRAAPEIALEQAIGCASDTETPVVLVMRSDAAETLAGKAAHVVVIPGLAKARPREILDAANRLTG